MTVRPSSIFYEWRGESFALGVKPIRIPDEPGDAEMIDILRYEMDGDGILDEDDPQVIAAREWFEQRKRKATKLKEEGLKHACNHTKDRAGGRHADARRRDGESLLERCRRELREDCSYGRSVSGNFA